MTTRLSRTTLRSAALALVAGACVTAKAAGQVPSPSSAVLEDPVLTSPFELPNNIGQLPSGPSGFFAQEISRATHAISLGYGEPPLLELPSFVMKDNHPPVLGAEPLRKVDVQDQQLNCAVYLQRKGIEQLLSLEQLDHLPKLAAEGIVTDVAIQQYVGMHLLNVGYYSYGNFVQRTVDKANPGTLTTERLQKAWQAMPEPSSEQEHADRTTFCVTLSLGMSSATEVSKRIERLAEARIQLYQDIARVVAAKSAENETGIPSNKTD